MPKDRIIQTHKTRGKTLSHFIVNKILSFCSGDGSCLPLASYNICGKHTPLGRIRATLFNLRAALSVELLELSQVLNTFEVKISLNR